MWASSSAQLAMAASRNNLLLLLLLLLFIIAPSRGEGGSGSQAAVPRKSFSFEKAVLGAFGSAPSCRRRVGSGSMSRSERRARNNTNTIEEQEAASSISSSSLSLPSEEELGRRARKKRLRELEYKRRRDTWMRKYGSLSALQRTFGTGPNLPWGDLSPTQTRALYHTLLPRSLLALSEMGLMRPEELAPLAYEARIAAKEYARSRCVWTGRLVTSLFDQYRSLRDKGRLVKPGASSSMSWEEIWNKYEGQIVREVCEEVLQNDGESSEQLNEKKRRKQADKREKLLNDEDLTMRIYMRILEKSCATNQAFDSLFLDQNGTDMGDHNIDLASIASKLDHDVRSILLDPKDSSKATKKAEKMKEKRQKALEKETKREQYAKKKETKKRQKRKEEDKKKRQKRSSVSSQEQLIAVEAGVTSDTIESNVVKSEAEGDQKSSRGHALKILAGTRRKFRLLFGSPE